MGVLRVNKKKFRGFYKKNCGFSRFKKILPFKKLLDTNFFLILIIHKPFLGSRDVPQKIWV